MEVERGLALVITELRLGLPGADRPSFTTARKEKKRCFTEIVWEGLGSEQEDDRKALALKSPVIGWPPVCSYRKKNNNFSERDCIEYSKNTCVKVSMDGAIYLRKVDLSLQRGYSGLALALEKLFDAMALPMKGSVLSQEHLAFRTNHGCYYPREDSQVAHGGGEYKLIYEDKDGDWMLVGDVPWEMFTKSCKRLRIMKRSVSKHTGLLQERDFFKGAFLKDE
ncbi:hypothetical protein SAY86_001874 [Trapa natans]|uniref:Auxin-responsive protein n=1 Tax=Trapa natans TaxID=22666 RepID=A0AAN7LPP0_TRANT|nr:hypothetical protein SAY86_001874 [Trapa natans]